MNFFSSKFWFEITSTRIQFTSWHSTPLTINASSLSNISSILHLNMIFNIPTEGGGERSSIHYENMRRMFVSGVKWQTHHYKYPFAYLLSIGVKIWKMFARNGFIWWCKNKTPSVYSHQHVYLCTLYSVYNIEILKYLKKNTLLTISIFKTMWTILYTKTTNTAFSIHKQSMREYKHFERSKGRKRKIYTRFKMIRLYCLGSKPYFRCAYLVSPHTHLNVAHILSVGAHPKHTHTHTYTHRNMYSHRLLMFLLMLHGVHLELIRFCYYYRCY